MTEMQVHTDAYFDNMQLTKLVSSAEAIFEHIYELVSSESKSFIDQWLCYKHEFDTCSSSHIDGNENFREYDEFSSNRNYLNDDSYESDQMSLYSVESYDCASDAEMGGNKNNWILHATNESALRDSNQFSNVSSPTSASSLRIKEPNRVLVEPVTNKSENKYDNVLEKSVFPSLKALQLNMDHINKSWLNLKNESFQFCRYCASETMDYNPASSMRVDEQISYLREIKEPLLKQCGDVTTKMRHNVAEVTTLSDDLFLYQEILDMVDTCIEIKNNISMSQRKIDELITTNYLVYSILCNCLKMLSINELRYIFIVLVKKVAELRVNSSPLDKLILQLDNVIVDKEIRLRYLNKNYVKLRDMYLNLRDKNDSPRSTHVKGHAASDLARFVANHDSNGNSGRCSDSSKVVKDEIVPLLPFAGNIPNRNLKALQCSTSSTVLGVRRHENKLIIHSNKNGKS